MESGTYGALLALIEMLESNKRFYDAAEGEQWFNERGEREANERKLREARQLFWDLD